MNKVLSVLQTLYAAYGYQRYKVSQFESYDLYVENRNFLQSAKILTFHDTNGQLMALKPDVTLSIIKNTKPDAKLSKVYYTENVYREPKSGDGYQEIPQTGLELIGTVGEYELCEVLMLAERSLRAISDHYVLDISHIGVLSGLLAAESLEDAQCAALMNAAGQKNPHLIAELCGRYGLSDSFCRTLCTLVGLYGTPEQVLSQAEALNLPPESRSAMRQLRRLDQFLANTGCRNVHLDFSLVNDMDYYSGLVFRGFVEGIASGVLSGGCYDRLLSKMGRSGNAIGFAVYLDQLERLYPSQHEFDVDIAIYYRSDCDVGALLQLTQRLTGQGSTVRVCPVGTSGIFARKKMLFETTEGSYFD